MDNVKQSSGEKISGLQASDMKNPRALVDPFLVVLFATGASVHRCIYTHPGAPVDRYLPASACTTSALVHALIERG